MTLIARSGTPLVLIDVVLPEADGRNLSVRAHSGHAPDQSADNPLLNDPLLIV